MCGGDDRTMKLTDMHCDTPFEIYARRTSLFDGDTCFTVGKCAEYEKVTQVMAFWSDSEKAPDECYDGFFRMFEYLGHETENAAEKLRQNGEAFAERFTFIPAVEGAKLLGGDMARLSVLAQYGVKILTPVWRGADEVGGAYDTDKGLTDFGKLLVAECGRLGIAVDVSHMSEKSFWDTVNIVSASKEPITVLASHSNSKRICAHERNLTDLQFGMIEKLGGVVGVSSCAKHISAKYAEKMPTDGDLFIDEVCSHIEHFLSLGGEDNVCLGFDFDGTAASPGLEDVSKVSAIAERLAKHRVCDGVIEKIIYANGKNFLGKIIKQP